MSRVFDGVSDQYIVTPASPVYSNLTKYTYSFWVYPRSFGAGNSGVLFVQDPNNNFTPWGGYLSSHFNTGGGIDGTTAVAASFLPFNQWTNFVTTYDLTGDKKAHVYINGVQATYLTQQATTSIGDNSGAGIYFGGDSFIDTWDGYIAEVALWNSVLSGSDITAVAASTTGVSGIQSGNLVGYWHLLGTSSPEPDSSGNGNDGVLVGGPTAGPNSPGYIPVTVYSVPDCRNYSIFPNDSRDVQDTLIYDVCADPSHAAPVDSRTAGAPQDCRVDSIIPLNSRTQPA